MTPKAIGYAGAFAALLLGGVASGAPNAPSAAPNFSPNPSVSWLVALGGLKPPPSGAGPVVDDPKHPTINNNQFRVTGKQPTFPVADLSNPILQPWARDALRKRNEDILGGKPGFGPRQSCWPRGVPGWSLEGGFQPIFIIQGPKEVIMVAQADNHQQRHIYLNVPHSKNPKPSWSGESVGYYEGDALVVDTIAITTKTFVDDYQTPHTDKLHVMERYRLVDGGKAMEATLHVEDPGAFTMPWDAVQRYRRIEPRVAENVPPIANDATSAVSEAGPLLEVTCSESPVHYYGDMLPVPQAAKPDF
jgi:hypothetical protein